ncbi:MAG: DUF3147 family protein [Chthoniobacteraceae bacterium]
MNYALLITKAVVSGGLIVAISELAKRNNTAASIVHSLPLASLLALIWLFAETRDTALIGRHMTGTFFFVLPTLPMFLIVPWMLRRGAAFWPALAAGVALTVALYFLTMRLLKAAGVNL